ncbi:Importin subunit beta-1 [Halotydeus destructor]|nr:Importin subunit beta-1 [Halotydeus destructor]
MDLITILTKFTSPEGLAEAQSYLEQATATNLPDLLKQLSEALSNASHPDAVRSAAGLQLKNALTSKDEDIKLQYQNRWLALPEDVRMYVKANVVNAIGTERARPSSAAQCVAYIAIAELPHGLWPDVIKILTQNVTNPSSTELVKAAALETIGYICQDIDPEILVTQSNEILTAIVHGMRKDEPSNHVKFAATTALLNSLEFTKANFDKDSERHFIMQVVCEATQSEDTNVKEAALQCLVKIMSLYYQYMEHYMGPALFAITVQAMRSDNDQVTLQGIEFWSNVCDEEVDLAIEAQEAMEQGRPPSRVSRHYAKGALQYLVPILMEQLTKQDEHDDDDDWNPCKAAGVCLMLMASCVEDDIVQHVLPFVHQNIRQPDWKFRDAAVMAFGSILEGPDPVQLKPVVEQAMPLFIELMKDPSVAVRDTTAWTIGRICELIAEAVISQPLSPLLEALVTGLNAEPRVAANVCWAFNSLAEAAYENAEKDDDNEPRTYILSTFFEGIVQRLLLTTERPDGNQANLRSAAYEALMELIKNSAKDCYQVVQTTTMTILQRLQQVLQLDSHSLSSNDRAQYNDLASLLCATLQSVLRKMTPEDAPQISDAVMQSLVLMFNASGKASGVQEDALMAVGTLVEVLGAGFMKYMEAFLPYLRLGLENFAEYQVCSAAVGLVADISRALGINILRYCDDIMTLMSQILANEKVHRSVKAQTLSVYGDIALAIGTEFKKYLSVVLTTLQQASNFQFDPNNYDLVDYANELRENCLESYTGIVQGLKGDKEVASPDVLLLKDHVPYMIQFVMTVASDPEITDNLIAACAGLIGDLTSAFGANILPLIDNDVITQLLLKGKRSKVSKTRTLCVWSIKEIKKLKMNMTGDFPTSTTNLAGVPQIAQP